MVNYCGIFITLAPGANPQKKLRHKFNICEKARSLQWKSML